MKNKIFTSRGGSVVQEALLGLLQALDCFQPDGVFVRGFLEDVIRSVYIHGNARFELVDRRMPGEFPG